MAGRLIFHCDGNNFFASCECIEHPEWRDVPMAVAGDPKDRCGIVVAKNELAKKAGVKTTDTIWQARQKCPNILFVPPHHDEYARVSRRMNAIFREYTDFVEPASIDESYLDMTGAPGCPRANWRICSGGACERKSASRFPWACRSAKCLRKWAATTVSRTRRH